jgi:thioredoxin 1
MGSSPAQRDPGKSGNITDGIRKRRDAARQGSRRGFEEFENTVQGVKKMKATIEVNESNFEAEVLKSERPVVVDFWAQWCGPCKMLAPVLDELASEQAGRAKVAKVNLDENPGLAARYKVQAIPTLLYFSGGEVKEMTVGMSSKRAIQGKLEGLLNGVESKR